MAPPASSETKVGRPCADTKELTGMPLRVHAIDPRSPGLGSRVSGAAPLAPALRAATAAGCANPRAAKVFSASADRTHVPLPRTAEPPAAAVPATSSIDAQTSPPHARTAHLHG